MNRPNDFNKNAALTLLMSAIFFKWLDGAMSGKRKTIRSGEINGNEWIIDKDGNFKRIEKTKAVEDEQINRILEGYK